MTVSSAISITNITNLPGYSWTATDILPLLSVQNEMRVLRYYSSPTLVAPTTAFVYDATNHPDQLSVSWPLPLGANTSQLEYGFVEKETQGYYNINGAFSTDKLFKLNSTRVDIDTSNKIFNIPLLYDADSIRGGGTLYYRVRSVLRKNDGTVITGSWSTPKTFAFNGHERNLNWQSSTSFAENGKSKTVIQYFDGSLRQRQTVTKDNSTGNTIVAETIYDLQGRPMVQILPTPTLSTAIDYYRDFNRFTGQATNDNPALYFDLSVAGTQCSGSPKLDTTRGNGLYYSANNPWKTIDSSAKFIPGANGYAYTETRYTDDPTQRISSQGGVGQAHQIGNAHETKYYYGKPTQNELDALFGTEAGDASHYFKNMVQDANGQMSVSYVDMHGRTIATALAGNPTAKLATINNNSAYYPASSGKLTGSLLTPATNIIKGDSIESISTILLSHNDTLNFTYQLTPAILQQLNNNNQQICFDCKYNLEISIRQEDCSDVAPLVKRFNNLQIVAPNLACGTPMGFIGDNGTTPQTQISFMDTLTAGSWVVRKTLSINDSIFRVRRDSALNNFLFITQQHISDSVLSSLSAISGCNVSPIVRNCASCQAMLGSSYTSNNYAYKNNYIASVGGSTTLTDSAIHAQYTVDSLACGDACGTFYNPLFSSLAVIRAQMLNDMVPYTGQYAIPVNSISSATSLEAKYNIFTSVYSDTHSFGQFTNGTKPFYLNPVLEPNGVATFYSAGDGLPDNTIYPGGVSAPLVNIAIDSFTNMFNRSWSGQLIYYHPEYSKLKFAENNLVMSYNWFDKVSQCNSYAQASANGYLAPLTSDPYFINNYVPKDGLLMQRYLTHYAGKFDSNFPADSLSSLKLSIWHMANSQGLTDTTLPLSARIAFTLTLSNNTIDPSATTTPQKDAVWAAFKANYLGYRSEMLLAYINSQQTASLSQAAMDTLVGEGKQLRFANSLTIAKQNGLTWWAAATDTTNFIDSVGMATLANNYLKVVDTLDQCTAQRPFWKSRLLQCERLQQYLANQVLADSNTVTTITNLILDSMVMVCHNSINFNNPSGASNVNPALLPQVPSNFEDIVNHVFSQYGIATVPGNYYFCNPYSVDYPKAYNANPAIYQNNKATADTCNCQQFAGIKSSAAALGFDTTSMASVNTYLLYNYNDTLTLPLWQGLVQCYSHAWYHDTCYKRSSQATAKSFPDSCVHQYFIPIHLGISTTLPSLLSCGYVKPCISCSALQTYTAAFRSLYPAYAGVPFTTNVDTGMAKQNTLWARYLNYKTGFNITANEYGAAYLSCSSGNTDIIISNRTAQPPSGTSSPYLYTANNSITFGPGFTSNTGDNFQAVISSTALASTSYAICMFVKPVTYLPIPDTTHKNPCQSVQYEAGFIAQILFQQQKDSLTANFDSLYRAKCLGAQSTELFSYTYTPAEYHYTLYYYDQAGNLLKTLPPAAVQPNFDPTYLASVQTNRAAATDLLNRNNVVNLSTQYRYNTLNQVMAQKTPDAQGSHFWYDRLGRLAISQNAKQAAASTYSYTLYDVLGRITEVGQKPQITQMTQVISQDTTALKNWIADLTNGGAKQQMTVTIYDIAYPSFTGTPPITQLNLRNRVAYSQVIDQDNTSVPPYRAATFYSYDIHGNVDTLLQDYGPNSTMGTASGNRFKLTKYDYDLISGKVNQVSYQPGLADGFYHQYTYDAENRVTSVMTSQDSVFWQNDASYSYYRHGPLARTQLGDLRIQGIDYAYTLHGWLKSINPSSVSISGDLFDKDGTTTVPLFARDAYKLNLNYYDDGTYSDYIPIAPPAGYVQGNALPVAARNNLYNGNIGSMAVNIRQLGVQASGAAYGGPLIYNYLYDQLNRISKMDAWQASGNFTPVSTVPLGDFAERYSYDPNGNITTLNRHATTGNSGQMAMDSMIYNYKSGTNQLDNVIDNAPDAAAYSDIKQGQASGNYQYDAIGNLTADTTSLVSNITWSVYGNILSTLTNGAATTYTYDASGNRISKTSAGITTCYVRDASGNVMSVYVQGDNTKNSGSLTQTEIHLYGNSRLGLLTSTVNCTNLVSQALRTFTRGNKFFELTNHLGNVLVTISDKKVQHTTDNSTVDYYNPAVITANDYYSFGMQMPGRKFSQPNTKYRYGFNGQEVSDEINTSLTTAQYWEYDSRIGKRWNLDPILNVAESPYLCFSGNPILITDILGNEGTSTHTDKDGKVIAVFDDQDKGVYKHGTNADGGKPTLYQILKRHEKSTSAGGEKMGETITSLGFADFGEYERTGKVIPAPSSKIDFSSNWATDKINGLLKDNPTLGTYALKAGKEGDYDFKTKVPLGKGTQYGSLLFGKYASARDVGNIGAGIVAQRSIISNKFSDYGFGKYNQTKNSKVKMAWEIFGDISDFFAPDGTGQAQNRALESIRGSIYNGEDKLSKQGIDAGKTLIKILKK